MAEDGKDEQIQPSLRNNDRLNVDKYGAKLVDHADKLHDKAHHSSSQDSDKEKGPAGGYDATPIPKAAPGYTIRITFHSARNLPFADLSMTSDPYIIAVLKTSLPKRHKQDPDLTLRTPTIHRDTNPTWNVVWTIAHVPASGFHMKCRLYDEDPRDHDDRLGNVHVNVSKIDDNWKGFKEQEFRVKKRMGSKRAYTLRGCASLVSRKVSMDGGVIISVENLGKSKGDNGGQPFTLGPLPWSEHHSPLIGMIAGTKEQAIGKKGGKKTEKYNFQAIQMQLQGPVPEPLYHRYVEFKSFVAGMFTGHSLRGWILNHALHHQHYRIYNFDETTKYGSFDHPGHDMTAKFLEFVRYDQGGRIFTYVITLDGQFRFTETGKEFGIDMLSKHSMHSDVSIYIAFSGEFFVRRLKNPHKSKKSLDPATETMPPAKEEGEDEKEQKSDGKKDSSENKHLNPASDSNSPPRSPGSQLKVANTEKPRRPSFSLWNRTESSKRSIHSHTSQTHESEDPSKDPSHYELIIDNDSGTYRPNAQYLPQLKKFLQNSFPGLRVATLDCQKDAEKQQKLKSEQRERKKKSGQQIMYMQNSSLSSISSSEEEELERRVNVTSPTKSTKSGTLKKKYRHAKEKFIGDDYGDEDNATSGATKEKTSKAEGEVDEKAVDSANKGVTKSATHDTTEHATTASASKAEEKEPATKDKAIAVAAGAGAGAGAVATAAISSTAASKKHESSDEVKKEETQSSTIASGTTETKSQATSSTTTGPTSDRPTTALNKDNLEQHDQLNSLSFGQNSHQLRSQVVRKPSVSTDPDADRMSFNTAFTDAETAEHYVTPKPSLGDGGLRQFNNQTTNDEHESAFETPKAKTKTKTDGDVTPTANGHAKPITVHDVVTSNSFIGGGF